MRSKPFWLAVVLAIALVPLPVGATQEEAPPPGLDMLSAPSDGDPVDLAIAFIQEEAATYGVSRADVADLAVRSSYTSKHNGVTHVNLMQRYDGLEIFGATATVNFTADGSVLFVGENLVDGLKVASDDLEVDADAAVAAAAAGLGLDAPSGLRVLSSEDDDSQETVFSSAGISDEPIPARLGYQATSNGLRLAWQLVIDDSDSAHLWNATVDADTGGLLAAEDWTIHHNADELRSNMATALGSANFSASALVDLTPVLPPNQVNDGSKYNVWAFPSESPNDGPRHIVTNPAEATASPYGWNDTDGVPGPESTRTTGNNVHAYSDRDANNAPDPGSDSDGGPTLNFDFPLDLTEHSPNYMDAMVTNLYYWNNITHDVLYLYGFDEQSGNFQVNNYGRGGVGGDIVRAEAADGGGTNNANFSTPAADGGMPRMQMYLWPGAQFGLPNAVTIGSGPAAGTYTGSFARSTPSPTNAGTAGNLVLVDDGVDAGGDGCTAYVVPAGSIAVVDRTSVCNYYVQGKNAQAAGAVAMVVANNAAGTPPIMTGSMVDPVGIPTLMVNQADGATIKAALPVAGSVHRNQASRPIRDGDLDAGIVIHEYGHGVSLRLTGGPGINCLSGNEQMGEGWSDYLGLAMLLRPELDDPHSSRGLVPYALFQDSRAGNGLRPRPYSRNMNIQPFTYDMIKTGGWLNGTSLAVPHGIGHAWAAVLWDMTWDLIDEHGFNENIYEPWNTGGNNLAYQLVVDGMKLQGCGPGFGVGRSAIIAADLALTGGENYCTLWRSFARRGLGFSAIQGTTDRNDNTQAFDLPAECVRNQSRTQLLGENEVGGGDVDGTGDARISWNQSGKVCFDIRVRNIATPTAAHIHSGGHGVNGPVVVDFNIGANGLQGCVNGASQALLNDIRTNPTQYYVNVHNADFPGGAVRGQLN